MIDLHCHLLPALDDGPAESTDTLGMARQAQADGVTDVCATPHIRHDHDVRIHELPGRVEEVRELLRAAGIDVRLHIGGEVAETIVDHLDDDELRAVTLGCSGRWILLEPAPGPLAPGLNDVVNRLHRRGFRSIIAHPERHVSVDIFERLAQLVTEGALVQVTAATLTEPPASRGMRSLAEAGLVHVLGSDSHSSRFGRPVALSTGLGALAEVGLLEPHLAWIRDQAPRLILAGAEVDPPYQPRPPVSAG